MKHISTPDLIYYLKLYNVFNLHKQYYQCCLRYKLLFTIFVCSSRYIVSFNNSLSVRYLRVLCLGNTIHFFSTLINFHNENTECTWHEAKVEDHCARAPATGVSCAIRKRQGFRWFRPCQPIISWFIPDDFFYFIKWTYYWFWTASYYIYHRKCLNIVMVIW